jgi:hypothetical protein
MSEEKRSWISRAATPSNAFGASTAGGVLRPSESGRSRRRRSTFDVVGAAEALAWRPARYFTDGALHSEEPMDTAANEAFHAWCGAEDRYRSMLEPMTDPQRATALTRYTALALVGARVAADRAMNEYFQRVLGE